ncbi:hypothetical protein KEF85_11925 [Methylomonas paludis]|uniref:PEP-CTERM protein-sorting domain-containing protein n=1 Tax=Methylomonas paludis TaxID=1173101 RepID=A0A975MLK8_9GAMM|nr:hypothetical protein [Methylomonas paludis]QWF70057.1 hypothetical protein KEF85_11925 [Methylomonas paludis]
MKRLNLMASMATIGLLFVAQPAGAFVYGYSGESVNNVLELSSGNLDIYNSGSYWGGYSLTPGTTGTQGYTVALPTDPGLHNTAVNDFFVFNISGLSAPVTSATLQLQTFYVSNPAVTSIVTFYDYTGSIPELISAAGDDSVTIPTFNDLQSGKVYGSQSYDTGATPLPYKDITLNSNFLTDLNSAIAAHDQFFALGGHLTAAAVPEADEWMFIVFGSLLMTVVAARKKCLLD